MILLEQIRYSFKNLFRKKFRTALTIASIAIGVASVVLISTISEVGRESINQELNTLGLDGITIGLDKRNVKSALGEAELSLIQSNPKVTQASPMVLHFSEAKLRGLVADTVVWGLDAGAGQVISLTPKYGRLINKNDVSQQRNVCVVDENLARAFYKRDNIVGKEIRLLLEGGYEYFEIVGVVNSGGNILQSLMDGYIPSFVYLPYTTMQQASGDPNYDRILVKVEETQDIDLVGQELAATLSRANRVTSGYNVENIVQQKETLNKMLDIVTLILSIIAGISLVVAGLGIMTMMLVSVSERTREIGIKKSIGASKAVIMAEFLWEAFSLSLLGSFTGVVLGLSVAYLGSLPFGITMTLNYRLIGFCIAFTVCIGIVFGVYPAYLASKLKPVDALRYE